jgi:hypothetical protein
MRKPIILFTILLIPYGAFADRALFNKSSDTMDDITDGSTYVKTENNLTDAEKTILGNTSGTNTGDSASEPADAAIMKTDEAEVITAEHEYTANPVESINAVGNTGASEDLSFNTPVHTMTIDQATTLTFTDLPSSGDYQRIILKITNGDAFTITWAVSGGSVLWSGGTEETLQASGVDYLVAWCDDATNVNVKLAGPDMQ